MAGPGSWTMPGLLALCWVMGGALAYNVEVKKVGLARGERGSEFGFSVALTQVLESGRRSYVMLVGSPNRTINDVRGHGMLERCGPLGSRDLTCADVDDLKDLGNTCSCGAVELETETFHMKSQSSPVCPGSAFMPEGNLYRNCDVNQRLGATIAVNRHFTPYGSTTIPMVTVCAPSWKNVLYAAVTKEVYPIGMCLKLRDQLNLIPCYNMYCWPFWPTFSELDRNGRPFYSQALAGMSAAYTKDGYSEVIGAPGVQDWRGSYKAHAISWYLDLDKRSSELSKNTFYFGYSIDAGNLHLGGAKVVAGVPNYHSTTFGHTGLVQLLNKYKTVAQVKFGDVRVCGNMKMAALSGIDLQQVGTKFGAAVAAIDVTMDGRDEVFVGAPLYSGQYPEQGLVFVYRTTDTQLCGPVAVLSGAASSKQLHGHAGFGRFGTAISTAGDLNGDFLTDVIIGAPYLHGGSGAVFIYHGNMNGVDEHFAQQIAGRDIDSGLRGFGWSIYGGTDVDGNGYPDLAVGAYASEQAVLLRTRPVVNIPVSTYVFPSPIPHNVTPAMECSLGSPQPQLCFHVGFYFQAQGKNISFPVNVSVILYVDSLLTRTGRASRVEGSYYNDGSKTIQNNLVKDTFTILKYGLNFGLTLFVKRNGERLVPNDTWTPVVFEGMFEVSPSNRSTDFTYLHPGLNESQSNNLSAQVSFELKCDSQTGCLSDIGVTVSLFVYDESQKKSLARGAPIYLGDTTQLLVTVNVSSLNGTSYGANFSTETDLSVAKVIRSDSGSVEARCGQMERRGLVTHFNCTANSKLDRGDNFEVHASFDTSRRRLMPGDDIDKLQNTVEIRVAASQANTDTRPGNNVYYALVPVKLKCDVGVVADKTLSAQARFKADPDSSRLFSIVHRYTLVNHGPSVLPRTLLNITVPVRRGGATIAAIQNIERGCKVQGPDEVQQTTVLGSGNTLKDELHNVTSITCSDSECVTVQCEVRYLEKWAKTSFNITITLHENGIAAITNERETNFVTMATVTDPGVWYGNKTERWTTTPHAVKYTTLIKETESKKINIGIIIGSAVAAAALLLIVVLVLWRLGFFHRKQQDDVKKMRRATRELRRSHAMSTTSTVQQNTDTKY